MSQQDPLRDRRERIRQASAHIRRRLRSMHRVRESAIGAALTWIWLIGVYGSLAAGMLLLGATMRPYALAAEPYVLPTIIYSSDGTVLATLADEYRKPVSLAQVPDTTIHAILAAEDTRFYQHHGLDWRGIARALWINIRERRVVQGGSTITQQLVRAELLNDRRTLRRKIREVVLAIRVERGQTKEQILERYLNIVYFGGGAYGIAAAAQSYFGKSVERLTPAESALLAGLIRAPGDGNPRVNRPVAMRRQRDILAKMVRHDWLTPEEYRQAINETITVLPRKRFAWKAPYAVEMVRRQLIADYGRDMTYRGGLHVYTTIDTRLQRAAERAIRQAVNDGRRRRVGNGALVSIDVETGFIRAIVGGADFWTSQFNRATQARRQPGSTFKVFVYQAAIDHGHLLTDHEVDAPITVGNWRPHNYGNSYHGTVTLGDALARSLNSVAVRLAMEMSPFAVVLAAQDAGITSTLQPNLTIALGSSEVTPLEMARAFATFAHGGKSIEPSIIKEIRRENRILYRNAPVARQTVKPLTAFLLTQGLERVITSGTGRRAHIGRPAAGKTGTSNDFRDAWFVGYTPHLSTAVWLGNDNRQPMAGVAGGSLPAQAWAQFMRAAGSYYPPDDFRIPSGVVPVSVCTVSGKLALPTCPSTATRYLPLARLPGECDIHYQQTRRVCAETGLLANPTCPAVEQQFPYDQAPTLTCPIAHPGAPPDIHPESERNEPRTVEPTMPVTPRTEKTEPPRVPSARPSSPPSPEDVRDVPRPDAPASAPENPAAEPNDPVAEPESPIVTPDTTSPTVLSEPPSRPQDQEEPPIQPDQELPHSSETPAESSPPVEEHTDQQSVWYWLDALLNRLLSFRK